MLSIAFNFNRKKTHKNDADVILVLERIGDFHLIIQL